MNINIRNIIIFLIPNVSKNNLIQFHLQFIKDIVLNISQKEKKSIGAFFLFGILFY